MAVEITSKMVKALRDQTGAGMMDCKKALQENAGDSDKAVQYLREKGLSKAAKRADREVSEGRIIDYIHHSGKIGVLLELNCETDFVAKNEKFQALGKDIAMHIAASNPLFLDKEAVDQKTLEEEQEIYRQQAVNDGKPADIANKIATGRLEKYYKEVCLLEQPFVKDSDRTVADIVKESIGVIGENISVRRFVRFQVGE